MPCTVNGSTIVLSGDVGDMGWYYDDGDRGFGSGDVIAALAQIGDGRDVTVRLNSGGGIATEGSAIHAALRRHRGRKTVCVEGIAASAASAIAMAGDEVVMCLGSIMMIHDPAGITVGTAADHEGTIAGLTALADAMASLYAAKSGRTPEACRADMKAEIWMTPDEAVAKGYADRVEAATLTGAQPVEPAAFPYTAYHHAPARMVALARANRWDRNVTPKAATAADTPKDEAAMPTEEEIQARVAAAVAEERAKHPVVPAPALEPATVPAPVAALMRSEASAIARACADGGVPGMTAALLAEGVTLAVAQARIGQAGSIKDMVALARRGTPTIPADYADQMISAGKTVSQVKDALFDRVMAQAQGSDDSDVRSFHRAGAGGADRVGERPDGASAQTNAAARARGKALMTAEVERQGMVPRKGH